MLQKASLKCISTVGENIMNNNPNDPQELECQLRAKAVAELQESIIKDLECEDKSIAEILGKDTNEDKATEDDSGSST
mgnify:CR=1 FL=1